MGLIKFTDVKRQYAFVFDGKNVHKAMEHAEILNELDRVENAFDTDEDPRDLLSEEFLVGTENLYEGKLLYEIMNPGNKLLKKFSEVVNSKEIYKCDFKNNCFVKIYKEE